MVASIGCFKKHPTSKTGWPWGSRYLRTAAEIWRSPKWFDNLATEHQTEGRHGRFHEKLFRSSRTMKSLQTHAVGNTVNKARFSDNAGWLHYNNSMNQKRECYKKDLLDVKLDKKLQTTTINHTTNEEKLNKCLMSTSTQPKTPLLLQMVNRSLKKKSWVSSHTNLVPKLGNTRPIVRLLLENWPHLSQDLSSNWHRFHRFEKKHPMYLSNCQLQGLPTWSRLMDCSAKSRNWLLSNRTKNTMMDVFFPISGGCKWSPNRPLQKMTWVTIFVILIFSSASLMIHGFLKKNPQNITWGGENPSSPFFWGPSPKMVGGFQTHHLKENTHILTSNNQGWTARFSLRLSSKDSRDSSSAQRSWRSKAWSESGWQFFWPKRSKFSINSNEI